MTRWENPSLPRASHIDRSDCIRENDFPVRLLDEIKSAEAQLHSPHVQNAEICNVVRKRPGLESNSPGILVLTPVIFSIHVGIDCSGKDIAANHGNQRR